MSNLARIAYDTRTSSALMNEACTIDAMSAIWRRALKRISIGPDENFFLLGGTLQIASELFQHIAKQFGRELPDFVIFQAPTIREMVAILADPQPPQCAPLSQLKRGSNRVAIFLAHGMGGDASQLFEIASGLQVTNPVYATQPLGIDGRNKPFDRIEDMAATYLKAIREIQPNGPYLLIGYSLGGLVMMEVAQYLLNQGERIELLAMLDTYPHRTSFPVAQRLAVFAGLATRRLAWHARSFNATNPGPKPQSSTELIKQAICSAEFIAWRSYRPRFYQGKLLYLKAETSSFYPIDPSFIWPRLTSQVEFHTVPGNHVALVSDQCKVVADVLTRFLREGVQKSLAGISQ